MEELFIHRKNFVFIGSTFVLKLNDSDVGRGEVKGCTPPPNQYRYH